MTNKFVLILLLLLPLAAFARLINYESPAWQDLAKGNYESANYIPYFCRLASYLEDDCMCRLIVAKGTASAEKCSRKIVEVSFDLQKELGILLFYRCEDKGPFA